MIKLFSVYDTIFQIRGNQEANNTDVRIVHDVKPQPMGWLGPYVL